MKRSYFVKFVCCALGLSTAVLAEPIPVRLVQRDAHRSMVTRTEAGAIIARHEFTQVADGDEVTMHFAYYFNDGSLDDEVTTFTQNGMFRLVRDRHIQKGPFFTRPVDYAIEFSTGTATIRTPGRNGKTNTESRHVRLPDDLANGLIGVLLLNAPPDAKPFHVEMLAPVGGGRLVQIMISREGEQSLQMGGRSIHATVFRVHPDLGGIVGWIATLIGVQPKDVLVWVMQGQDPAVVKIVGQLGGYGPIVTSCVEGISFGDRTLTRASH